MTQSKDFTYQLLTAYLASKPEGFAPTGAVQIAHLAARAAVSGDTAAHAMYSKGALEALKGFAKSKGYTVDVNAADVVGMAVVSESKYPESPDDRYLARLEAAGRAKKIAAPKSKTSPKAAAPTAQSVGLPADFASMLATMVAEAVKQALK